MNQMLCGSKDSGSQCLLAIVAKVLMVVIVAELAVFLFALLAAKDGSLDELLKIILRLLIVGIGVFILFRGKKPKAVKDETNTNDQAYELAGNNDSIQMPNIDALTRTSNETGLTISILELMALAERYGHKLSIGMIKVDGIDALEKNAADDAMINMAGLMTESLRLPDRIGRFRENVFMILLPESNIDGAEIVAHRLRGSLQQNKAVDTADQVSVWIGMTEFQRGEDLQSLLDRVEAAADQSRNEDDGVCITV